MAEKNKIDRYK